MSGAVTEDALLGGRLRLRQPADGFRAAIDPILLAAAVPAAPGQRVLELGTGTGVAALCLARRVPGARVVGLELQPALARLAAENARINGLDPAVSVVAGDVAAPPFRLGGFDHVMANPPYLERGSGTLPPDAARALAVGEGPADLGRWLAAALDLVRPRGTLTLVHRADRMGDLLRLLAGRAGGIVVFPLWPGEGRAARRILLAARRGSSAPLTLAPGLVLHGPGGRFTPAAEAILRDGAALPL